MDTLEIFARFEAERSAATLTSAKVMEFVELIVHTMGGTVPSTSIDPTAPRRARYAAPFLLHRPPKASDPCTTSDRRPGNHRGRSGDMTRLHSTPTYLHDLDLLYTPILREFDAAGRPRWMAPCVGEAGGIEPLDSLYAHIRDSGPPFDAAGHSRFMIPCVGEAGGVGDLDLAVGPFHRCTARRRRRTIRLLSAEDHVPRSPHIRSLGSPDNGGCPDSEDGDSDAK
ncbi:hypothetical protein B0H11DRAFT_1998320 [Mycena galericulata]|nr:hypothetical protein B0H11DRAFT_1998320 [Mycena galericulata]